MMITLAILFSIVQLSLQEAHSKCEKCICGMTAHDKKMEVLDYGRGSEKADVKVANWVVIVNVNGAEGDGGLKKCGGVVITSKHVLTSAHCIWDESRKPPSMVKDFKMVTVQLRGLLQNRRKVMSASVHEDFDFKTEKDDLAILTLEKEIMWEKDNVSPICLPSVKSMYEGDMASSYGFGQTENMEDGTPTAQIFNVTVQSSEVCMNNDGKGWAVFDKEKELCAGSAMYTACEGDDGGPLVVVEKMRYTLIGISTTAQECYNFQGGKVGLYQKIHSYKKWIQENAPGAQDSNCDWM